MKFSILHFAFLATLSNIFTAVAASDDTITCSADSHCPEDKPCCSQFGICGTGAYCLGGCDIRFSYNLTSCMPMPRMSSFQETFDSKDKIKEIELQSDYLGNSTEADWVYTGWVDYYDNSLLLQMPNHTTGTVVSSTKYLWYGKVGATLKTSHGGGVVTAFILFSDVQDEIDYEFVGYNLTSPQSNFYSQGILNYNNSRNSTVNDTFEYYHNYEMDWTEDKIDWYVDGEKVRTLNKKDTWNETSNRFDYPQTPSRIQFSLWPGGDSSNGKGTIEWAGGLVNWDSEDIKKYGYFYAHIKEIYATTHDLPNNVKLDGNSTKESDYHAFLYNSTDGNDSNIILTTKKTWLGSDDATGFDPQNEDDNDNNNNSKAQETTITSTSGSSTITSVKTDSTKKTANVPAQNTAAAAQATAKATTAATTYNPSAGVGGFVQDSKSSDSGSSSSGSGSGSGSSSQGVANSLNNNVVSGIFASICLGVLSFFM
ncbi:chitin transglycosidase, putative [Candida dubliniensis CD36]|uniref:Crh-like protein n=1 Tax=Candida dubliniensis (strain CD36 / ATCC MYA-646 / CBS 7987 / NCPF 3949 / NRRL Y-17841) TaxID=573826 RepID=B9WDD9_CANDC|nr:chitin transglycosidase, putative [Candida dubliniensis CD36]CAX42691.1 chitin transglycosidase, putative [Candida dubliniensis CD36]